MIASKEIEDIIKYLDKSQRELIRLTQNLVKKNSENKPPIGFEKECQDYIASNLEEMGLTVDIFNLDDVPSLDKHPAHFPGRNYTNRPNVVGMLKGAGSGKSLILNGHIDTVPVGRLPWSKDPFSGCIEDGKLYGRGSLDMKGGIAAMITAIRCFLDLGVTLKGDVIIESVVDEEFAGSNGNLACILRGFRADAAIMPEPTYLSICPAHRGLRMAHVTITGKGGVAFAGEKIINPMTKLNKLLEILSDFERARKEKAKKHPLYSEYSDPAPLIITKLRAGYMDPGTPLSIPSECWIEVFWETMPGEMQREVEKEFLEFVKKGVNGDAWLRMNEPQVEFWLRWLPGSSIDPAHSIVKTVEETYKEVTSEEAKIIGAPFPCDAFTLNMYANTPTIIFGPRGGNAHGPDEFVYVEDLVKVSKVLAITTLKWCGLAN